MRVQLELNKTEFVVRIVSVEDNSRLGYVCESDTTSKIYLTASEAINETYKNLFNNKTRYSGPSALGFDNENIIQELLSDVLFSPFKITVDKLSILVTKLGVLDNNVVGYQSSLCINIRASKVFLYKKLEIKSAK